MSNQSNERRCKIFRVDCRAIMALFGNWWHHDYVHLPVLKDVPEGYIIRRVSHDFSYDAILLLVEHESFPEVPEGGIYPTADGFAGFECVRIVPPQQSGEKTAAVESPQKKRISWEFLGSP